MKWLILGLVGIASISLLRMVLGSSKKNNKFASKGRGKGRGKYNKKGGWKSKKDQLKRFINRHRDKEISEDEEVETEVDPSSAPQVEVKEEKAKPVFSGPKLYSYFKCILCDRSWKNGNSCSGEGQTCASCQINVLPWRQDEIKPWKKKKRNTDKEHSFQTCPKCQDLGRPCGQGQDPKVLLGGMISLKQPENI